MPLRNVVLVDGARTAFARGAKGKLVATRLDDAGAQVVRALLDRNPKVKDSMIEDAGLGNVGGWGEFTGLGVMTRLAGLPLEVCSFNSNRQCGSSMETLQRIAMAIEVGTIDCGLALGVERMGRGLGGGATGPQNRNTKLNPRLFQMNDAQKRMAPDHDQTFSVPFPDYILNSPPLQAMVQTAQNAAECYGLGRAELDAFSAESHRKAAAATAAGIYKDEIVPLEVEEPVFDDKGEWNENETGKKVLFDKDECIRADTTAEKLAALQPVKGVISFGGKEVIITAGNSCPTNDAVSAALLMSETMARKLGLTPLAQRGRSTASSSTRRSRRRCCRAARTSGSRSRRSTSTAARSRSATRSAPPARGWSRPSPRSCAAPASATASPPSASAPAWASAPSSSASTDVPRSSGDVHREVEMNVPERMAREERPARSS
jgi:acetyl-CoA acetyltransferase family protein